MADSEIVELHTSKMRVAIPGLKSRLGAAQNQETLSKEAKPESQHMAVHSKYSVTVFQAEDSQGMKNALSTAHGNSIWELLCCAVQGHLSWHVPEVLGHVASWPCADEWAYLRLGKFSAGFHTYMNWACKLCSNRDVGWHVQSTK